MKNEERIKVKITRTNLWYKKGEVHEVGNYITFEWFDGRPFYEQGNGCMGIDVADCEIYVPEYTMKELIEKIGHRFTIKTE